MRAAIIAREDHQRIVIEPFVLQRLQHMADIAIQRADHRRINAQAVILNHRQRVVIFLRRL